MATRHVLADLVGIYEQRTGQPVEIKSMGGVKAAQTIRAGAEADVIILASNIMEQLETEGYVLPGSSVEFALSGVAMAVRSGLRHPGISDEESVKRAILDASKVCYSTGPSGDYLMQLWKKWGLVETILQRAIQAPAGTPVSALLARGDADLGFQQMSELLDQPGIEIVGPMPPEIQAVTVFTAGICTSSPIIEDARDLLAFLASAQAEAAKRQYGMEAPIRP